MKNYLFITVLVSLFFISCKSDKKNNEQLLKQETKKTELNQKPISASQDATHITVLKNTQVLWEGFKLTSSHNGSIALKKAYVDYKEGTLKNVYFEIDMNSIKNLDMPADDPYNKKLVDHLKSPDFFDTAQFPTASFKSTQQSNSKEGQVFLMGDLTIKGITKSVSFPISLKEENNIVYLKAKAFNIDRTDFGIKYKSKKFFDNLKDKFIKDEFEIAFDIKLGSK